jgi:hypothetical protein
MAEKTKKINGGDAVKTTFLAGAFVAATAAGLLAADDKSKTVWDQDGKTTISQSTDASGNSANAAGNSVNAQALPAGVTKSAKEIGGSEQELNTYLETFKEKPSDASAKAFQSLGIVYQDANKDGKFENIVRWLDIWRGNANHLGDEYAVQALVIDTTTKKPKAVGSEMIIGVKDGVATLIENEQFTKAFVPKEGEIYKVQGQPNWQTVTSGEFIFTKADAEKAGITDIIKGTVDMPNYFWALEKLPVKDGSKFKVKKYETKPKLINGKLEAVTGKKDVVEVDELSYMKVQDSMEKSKSKKSYAGSASNGSFPATFIKGSAGFDSRFDITQTSVTDDKGNKLADDVETLTALGGRVDINGQFSKDLKDFNKDIPGAVYIKGDALAHLVTGNYNLSDVYAMALAGYAGNLLGVDFEAAVGYNGKYENLKDFKVNNDGFKVNRESYIGGPVIELALPMGDTKLTGNFGVMDGNSRTIITNDAVPGYAKVNKDFVNQKTGSLKIEKIINDNWEASFKGKLLGSNKVSQKEAEAELIYRIMPNWDVSLDANIGYDDAGNGSGTTYGGASLNTGFRF